MLIATTMAVFALGLGALWAPLPPVFFSGEWASVLRELLLVEAPAHAGAAEIPAAMAADEVQQDGVLEAALALGWRPVEWHVEAALALLEAQRQGLALPAVRRVAPQFLKTKNTIIVYRTPLIMRLTPCHTSVE